MTSRLNYTSATQSGQQATTPTLNQAQNSLYFTRYQTTDYASGPLQQVTTEVIDPEELKSDYYNLPYSVKRPDQTQDSYAYHFGSYDYGTKAFTSPGNGSHMRTVVPHGSTSSVGADNITTYDGNTVTSIYLVRLTNRTIDLTIRNPAGLVVRTETWVYTGAGSYAQVTTQDLTYDGAGRLSQSVSGNGATVSNTYANGRLTSTVGADGTETQFTYDSLR